MKSAVAWLRNAFGARRARAVAAAYANRLDPAGANARLVLRDLARYCNATCSSFAPGDPYQTAFGEGQRDVFNHVLGVLGLRPDDFAIDLGTADHDDD